MTLSKKHEMFCIEYVQCWSGTEAYSRVYPNVKRETCWVNGSKLLRNAQVAARIQEFMNAKQMQAEEVLARLSDQARGSHEPFIRITHEGFVYFDFSNPEAKNYMHLIKKIKTKRTRRVEGHGEDAEEWEDEWVEVELHDAQAALQLIGKHQKLFADQVKVTHTLTVEGLDSMLDKIYGTDQSG